MTDRQNAMPERRPGGYLRAAAAFAVGMAGTTLPTPLYGLYQDELGFSELIVTVVFAVYAFGVMGVLLLAGNVSDTVGRRPVLLCGLGLAALSAVCFLSEGGLPLLYLGRLLSGLSAGLFTGAATAYVMECAPPGKEGRAAFASTAANMGGLGCGPLLAGLLAEYAPWPLSLPFVVHIVLVGVAFAMIWSLAETVPDPRPLHTARPQGPSLPPQVRQVFVPAALAAFVGFSLLGVFTSVSPAFLTHTLDVTNLTLIGLIVFLAFFSSTIGQLLVGRLGVARALPLGCLLLIAGLGLLAGALTWEKLPLVVLSALVGGAGQGLALRAAVAAVADAAPQAHRAGVISSLFVVAYTGISIPVIGIGVLSEPLGLEEAGLVFIGVIVLLAAAAGVYLVRRPAVGVGNEDSD